MFHFNTNKMKFRSNSIHNIAEKNLNGLDISKIAKLLNSKSYTLGCQPVENKLFTIKNKLKGKRVVKMNEQILQRKAGL